MFRLTVDQMWEEKRRTMFPLKSSETANYSGKRNEKEISRNLQ